MDFVRPIKVEARDGYKIWLEYADGVSGEVDLSDVAGEGIFKAWEDRAFFESVHLTPLRAIAWNDEIDLCADALYMEITGLTFEEVYPDTVALRADA